MSVMAVVALLGCGPGAEPPKEAPTAETDEPVVDTDEGVETDEETRPPCSPSGWAFLGTRAFGDLQEALDASVAGDTIEVCPGVWTGTWRVLDDVPRVIVGMTGRAEDVVLSGRAYHPTLEVRGEAPEVEVRDLTFSTPEGAMGAIGLRVSGTMGSGAGRVVVSGCRFVGHRYLARSPALDTVGIAEVVIEDSVFEGTDTQGDAPVTLHGVERLVRVARSRFEGLRGVETAGVKIARLGWSTGLLRVVIEDSAFVGNEAHTYLPRGMAVQVSLESVGPNEVVVRRSRFEGNRDDTYLWGGLQAGQGGALFVGTAVRAGPTSVVVEDSVFDDNGGHFASHIRLSREADGAPWTARIARTVVWRGSQPAEFEEACVHAAVFASAVGGELELEVEDVDVGAGPTATFCTPFWECRVPLEGLVSGVIRPHLEAWCPE